MMHFVYVLFLVIYENSCSGLSFPLMESVALCRTSAARSLRHSNEITYQLEVGRGVKPRRKYL